MAEHLLQDLPICLKRFGTDLRCLTWALRPTGCRWLGGSGHGFLFGPLIGESLAEVVRGRLEFASFQRWVADPARTG